MLRRALVAVVSFEIALFHISTEHVGSLPYRHGGLEPHSRLFTVK